MYIYIYIERERERLGVFNQTSYHPGISEKVGPSTLVELRPGNHADTSHAK